LRFGFYQKEKWFGGVCFLVLVSSFAVFRFAVEEFHSFQIELLFN